MDVVNGRHDPESVPDALGVVVLGMHRSGTSAVTGLFAASGYHIGSAEDLMEPDWGNPAGYHERLDVLQINEELMAELGGSWIDPPEPERQLQARPEQIQRLADAVALLLDQAGGRPVGLKDPRIAALLPLWGPAINGRLHPVLVVRDPLSVAASLLARGGTPVPLGLAAWEMHVTSILSAYRGSEVTVAPYEGVMTSPDVARTVVADATARIHLDRARQVSPDDGSGWLRQDLQHHRGGPRMHADHLTVRQLEIWTYLASLPAGNVVLDAPSELCSVSQAAVEGARAEADRLAAVQAAAATRAELADLLPTLEQLNAELERVRSRAEEAEARHAASEERLRQVVTSRSWRAVTAMRAIRRRLRVS